MEESIKVLLPFSIDSFKIFEYTAFVFCQLRHVQETSIFISEDLRLFTLVFNHAVQFKFNKTSIEVSNIQEDKDGIKYMDQDLIDNINGYSKSNSKYIFYNLVDSSGNSSLEIIAESLTLFMHYSQ